MHKYAKGDQIDFDDEEGAEAWTLWAKAASACGASLTVSCVLNNAAATKNWDAGGIQAPVATLTLSNENPQPSPCFAMLHLTGKAITYDKKLTASHAVHLELQPQERRPFDAGAAGPTQRTVRMHWAGGCKLHSLARSGF